MIVDSDKIPDRATLSTDVCVVGSGAAGITLAVELDRAGVDTVVLTGGQRRERSQDRDLYRGSVQPAGSHEPLEENRRRAFGGSTIAWGGRCVPLDPVDFEPRTWIPYSGWPISYSELLPYYHRAVELCEAGPFAFDAAIAFSPARAQMIDGFDGPDVTSSSLERWSPPTNFAKRYGDTLRNSHRIRTVLGGHAVHIGLHDDGRRVEHLRAATRPGHSYTIRARRYVLAAGGLENPRLLLAANDVQRDGIGNANGLVGRFYMSHLLGVAAKATVVDRGSSFRHGFEVDPAGVYCRRRFALTPQAQTERQVGNAMASFIRPPISNAAHRDPLFSAAFLAKHYVDIARRGSVRASAAAWRAGAETRRPHLSVIRQASPRTVVSALGLLNQRYFAKRRLPMLLADAASPEHHLCFQTEQVPNRDSRLSLTDDQDAFGLPRIAVAVAFDELDVFTVVELHRAIAGRFSASGTGCLHFDEKRVREQVAEDLRHFNSQAHHLGTTRMGESAGTSVVDATGRVHDVQDLYVVGSSVFPTAGHANPTLTIVALAVRLADHLRENSRH